MRLHVQQLYNDLKNESEQKLERGLREEEKRLIQWMVEKTLLHKNAK
ncbi:hypothetical protein [Halobacillus amylolyticus]|uniref:Fur-regulated basic protein FbpA n=1 Tax=Halobacillus amylolyticus TaxID=2932259 RepID=A0ABY4HFK6_9BACI|nr:hypothetical protein [Halobacillus amylolyticus]UOR13659.1 hypothetical protein MUO15_09550 [Halobacillus amylolyticus]